MINKLENHFDRFQIWMKQDDIFKINLSFDKAV